MAIKLGNTDINSLGLINKAYLGVVEVFSGISFVSLWETTGAAETITLPTPTNYVVDWGDGTVTTNTNNHEYANIGQYTIKIKGVINDFSFGNTGDKIKILNVSSFGGLTTINGGFWGCTNLNITAIDIPNVSVLTAFFSFDTSLVFNPSINDWDTTGITSLLNCFNGANSFNQPLSNWDLSQVNSLFNAFTGATAFNQDISLWNVSSVTTMSYMFDNAIAFNQDLSLWDTSSVTDISFMFNRTDNFNGNISTWNVSNVTNMTAVFQFTDDFNQPLNSWNISSVTTTFAMFYSAKSFDQPLNAWNMTNVIETRFMFTLTDTFNQPLNDWDVSSVADMRNMFQSATSFDQNISDWDFSSVTNMNNFMSGKSAANYSTTNMDALYNKLDNVTGGLVFANMTSVNLTFGTINYTSAGATARASLVSKGFVIASGVEV